MLLLVVGVSDWHLARWNERGTGAQPVELRRESLALENCKEQWRDVIYDHWSLPALLSVTPLPASGCDWHSLSAPSPEKRMDPAVCVLTPMYIFPIRIQGC